MFLLWDTVKLLTTCNLYIVFVMCVYATQNIYQYIDSVHGISWHFLYFQRLCMAGLLFCTFWFSVMWQFNQFVLLLQAMALFGTQVLQLVPNHKVIISEVAGHKAALSNVIWATWISGLSDPAQIWNCFCQVISQPQFPSAHLPCHTVIYIFASFPHW